MKYFVPVAFVGVLFSIGIVSAESEWISPVYTVERTQGAITVDGVLDETDWAMAKSVGDFVFSWWDESKGPKAQTIAKVLWDEENLYLGFFCHDPYVYAEFTERDEHTFRDDCVELFAAPDPKEVWQYYGFEINARGVVLDYYRHPGGSKGKLDFSWNAEEMQIVSSVMGTLNDDSDRDQFWTVEVAIPFSDFRMYAGKDRPEDGDVWRANLNRCGGKTQQQYSQWSSSGTERPNFHVPERFGELRFSKRSVRERTWSPPEYTIERAKGKIRVDGKLDEADWRTAKSVGDFSFAWWDESKGAKDQTVAKLLWDDEHLYLSYLCYDPYISTQYEKRDDPVYLDDCVEAFIAPEPEQIGSYYGFEINAKTACLDYLASMRKGLTAGAPWNAEGLQIAYAHDGTWNDDSDTDRSWTIEVAVPLSNFEALTGKIRPEPGDVWRLNLNRCGGKTKPQYSQWSPSDSPRPNFHVPPRFGRVVFSDTD